MLTSVYLDYLYYIILSTEKYLCVSYRLSFGSNDRFERHERDYNNDLAPVIQGIFDNSELSLGLIDQSFNDIRYIRDALDFLNLAIPSITSAEDVHKVIEYLE